MTSFQATNNVLSSFPISDGGINQNSQSIENQIGHFGDWKKHPRISFFRELIRKRIAEILGSSTKYEQVQEASNLVFALEHQLFINAISEEDYKNQETLIQRLQTICQHKMYREKSNQQRSGYISSLSFRMPSSGVLHGYHDLDSKNYPLQKLNDAIFPECHTLAANNANHTGFLKGNRDAYMLIPLNAEGLPFPPCNDQATSDTILSLEETSSVITYSDGDGGAMSNLQTSSKSSLSCPPQKQHLHEGELDRSHLNGCLGAFRKTEPVVTLEESPQSCLNLLNGHITQRIPEVSNIFPCMISCNQPEISLKSQHLMCDSQQNLRLPEQPYCQSEYFFVDENDYHCQVPGRYTFKQPQISSGKSIRDQVFAIETSSTPISLSGIVHANSCIGSDLSVENKILLSLRSFKSFVVGSQISFVKYLHMTVCKDGICICERYPTLVSHFDNCQGDDCYICWSLTQLGVTPACQPGSVVGRSKKRGSNIRFNGPDSMKSKDMLLPTKQEKIGTSLGLSGFHNEISHVLDPAKVPKYSHGVHQVLPHQPQSPLSIKHVHTESGSAPFEIPVQDSTKIAQINNKRTTGVSGHGPEEIHPKSNCGISGNIIENDDGSESNMCIFPKDQIANQKEDADKRLDLYHASPETQEKNVSLRVDHAKEMNSVRAKEKGVSLTEFFTADQIRDHIMSLRKHAILSSTEGERGIGLTSCQLCASDKLFFAPAPMYCSFCGARIKRQANYYCKAEDFETQYCFCTQCYKGFQGPYITFNGISIAKKMLSRKRNDEVNEEPWVQCDKCEGWQHQICALFNNERDLEGKAEYVCPVCCLKEIENGERATLPKHAVFDAKDLPRTKLSDHLEERLFNCLKQEREDRAKAKGQSANEVSGACDLVIRVVLSVDKQLKVNNQFLDIFCDQNYPAEFPYKSKVILLFQKIEGVDVCLFGMYIQEFGSNCELPNQRCVYISYLDSVKYFCPDTKTTAGEALRTFVYHEILIGYLDFCKKQGFATCYIWACPPLKGDDYILYCHPQTQKTPKSDKLRQWYLSMLRKAAKENIVVGLTNIYDHFFVPTGECNSAVTASRLPYFDGDYWSGAAVDMIRSIERDSGGEYQRKMKRIMTKRTLMAMGLSNLSDSTTTKDLLLMQKLGQTILPVKEDFIIVHLQFVCMRCREVILSGKRFFCSECKNFQLCERCHASGQNLDGRDMHTSASGEQHVLLQVAVGDIPFDTRENDIILDNELFENRHALLSFFQRNHFQFDTLRRAKHSSMMILHHLRNPNVLSVRATCSICFKATAVQQSWLCEICTEFAVCAACYKEKGSSCHIHQLTQHSLTAIHQRGNNKSNRQALLMKELLEVLQHASQCHSTKTQPCSYPNCLQIKKLFSHANKCTIRASGGCQHCKKAWMGLRMHSRYCREPDCRIPRCMDLKRHAEWLAMQSETRRRAAVVELVRQRAQEAAEDS